MEKLSRTKKLYLFDNPWFNSIALRLLYDSISVTPNRRSYLQWKSENESISHTEKTPMRVVYQSLTAWIVRVASFSVDHSERWSYQRQDRKWLWILAMTHALSKCLDIVSSVDMSTFHHYHLASDSQDFVALALLIVADDLKWPNRPSLSQTSKWHDGINLIKMIETLGSWSIDSSYHSLCLPSATGDSINKLMQALPVPVPIKVTDPN